MKKLTKHTSPHQIAQALHKPQELEISSTLQEREARVEMAAEILKSTGSKSDTALKMMKKLKCSLSSAYYYISQAQERDRELDHNVRNWFVWMILENALDLMDRLKTSKKNPKEEVGLLKTLSELVEKHMGTKETIDWSKVQLPEILVLQSMPEAVKSEWQGKSDAEIQSKLIELLKLDENPEDGIIEDIDYEETGN